MNQRSKTLRESARGESCVACGADDGTIVWCHSNELQHGKGKSIKAHDLLGLYLCGRCHFEWDAGPWARERKRDFFREHYPETMVRVSEKLAAGKIKL